MKVVILAGGYGTRISEYSASIPKPMIEVGKLPIIMHVMRIFAEQGFREFVVALGYKGFVIKEYFKQFASVNSDFTINLKSGEMTVSNRFGLDWNVTLIDTGAGTMTGGRIARLKEVLGEKPFFLTYGDGVADINISKLKEAHESSDGNPICTLTAVRPPARFGELVICERNSMVQVFEEKPQLQDGWINGGFMICEPEIHQFIRSDDEMLEREPFDRLLKINGLFAYQHHGFWQCMDTKRDHQLLNELYANAPLSYPWKV